MKAALPADCTMTRAAGRDERNVTSHTGLIHKDADKGYRLSFPDLPTHITAGAPLDHAFGRAGESVHFLHRRRREDAGEALPPERGHRKLGSALQATDFSNDAIVISTDHQPQKLADRRSGPA